eukprot:m.15671 g.15671  ORF g.15671 m.15671 type:complete len:152 (-) comp6734_c0_seq1:70-525(-)
MASAGEFSRAADGKRTLNLRTFERLCREDPAGNRLTSDMISLAFQILDLNGDGHISFLEYQEWCRSKDRFAFFHRVSFDWLYKIVETFRLADTDGSGVLSKSELYNVFLSLREHLECDESDFPAVWAVADADGSGRVSLKEFIAFFLKISQ